METTDLSQKSILDLPMTVWLTGDETYFTDFNMDADAVMAQLDIKRSRLTQISGKELRVGRTRIDRYIRPVFRPEDVQHYLDWSRAPATKQKSKTELSDIQKQFETRLEALLTHTSQPAGGIAQENTEFSNTKLHITKLHTKLCDQLQSMQGKLHRHLSHENSSIQENIQALQDQLLTVEAIAQTIPHIMFELKNIQVLIEKQNKPLAPPRPPTQPRSVYLSSKKHKPLAKHPLHKKTLNHISIIHNNK